MAHLAADAEPADAVKSGLAPVNGIKIWYATFGRGAPVILLHGGLANSNYWGILVRALAAALPRHRHGQPRPWPQRARRAAVRLRSDGVRRAGADGLSEIDKAALVGWSDGAIIGLDIALHHPERLSKLFAFAANSDPSGVKEVTQSPVFNAFIARARKEYEQLSPTPKEYDLFLAQITKMWESEPHWTADDLHTIKVPTWIVDADHDEAIKRENTLFMADNIPGSGLLIQPDVSHFSLCRTRRNSMPTCCIFWSTCKGGNRPARLFRRGYDPLRIGDRLAKDFRPHDRRESGLPSGEPGEDIHQLRDLRRRIEIDHHEHLAPRRIAVKGLRTEPLHHLGKHGTRTFSRIDGVGSLHRRAYLHQIQHERSLSELA